MRPSFLQRLALWAFLAVTWPLAYLPRSWNLALGSLGGRLFFRLNRRRQNIAVTNIKEAIKNQALDPDLDPEAVAKSSFANLGRTATESFCLLHRGLNYFKGHWTISGGESLQKALSECRESGRGIIFATAHLGNWELSSLAFSFQFDFVAAVVGRSQGGFLANEILTRIRTQDGTSFICKNGGAREMLKLLRSGRILGTLFDQADIVGHGGAKLDFMGKPALTTLGPLKLAARTGALIVPVFNRREGDHHFYEIHPTITPPVDWGQPWLLTTAQTLNNMLGDFIRRYPDQWMWGHRRWKTPEGLKEDPTSFG